MNRNAKIDLIIAHTEELKWYQEDVATMEAEREIRDEVSRTLNSDGVKERWNFGPVVERRARRDILAEEIRENLIGTPQEEE